ncbi:MAG: MurR/RpiR family transcriptional regulator [Rhodoglobus sp.]
MSSLDSGASSPLLTRLRSALPMLGPSEGRVVQALIDAPDSSVEWSTAELAAIAHTSPATVIRACQNLGFRGYQHLRLELARTPAHKNVVTRHLVATIFAEATDAISVSQQSLSTTDFDRAAAALSDAARVLMVGTGFSSPPIQDAALRFLTAGRPVDAPLDVQAQQFAARLLKVGDVCLAVSYSGANANTLKACSAAKDGGGATVIAITSFARSPLTRLADISLVTGPVTRNHDVDPHLSRISHGLVLHALQRAVFAQPDGDSLITSMRDVVADSLTDGFSTT